MNTTVTIMRHELRKTTRRAGFVVMTLIVPVIAIMAIGIARLVMSAGAGKPPEVETVGYVDQTGLMKGFTTQGTVSLQAFPSLEEAERGLREGAIARLIVIPADFLSTGVVHERTTAKELIPSMGRSEAIKSFITANLLSGKVGGDVMRIIEAPLLMDTVRLDSTGAPAKDQGGFGGAVVPLVFALLLTLSIIFSSAYLLNGLGEEKENRLMEILISRVTPRQLFTGKVLGFGAAGLLQVAVWLATLPLMLWMAASSVEVFSALKVPPLFYPLAFVYFLLGYLLVGVMNASMGAIGTSVRESQQLSSIFNMVPVIPLWLMSLFLNFPQWPVWTVLSIFPFTAPVMVLSRIGVTSISGWEIAASLAVLALSAVGGLLLASRLFGAYLLTYGRRPRLRDLIRTIGA